MKAWVIAVAAVSLASVSLASASLPAVASAGGADNTMSPHLSAIKGSTDEAYAVYSTTVDADGTSHTRLTRTYKGLRVRGGDFVLHKDRAGGLKAVSVGLTRPLALSTTPRVSSADAAVAARQRFAGKVTSVGSGELFVDASSGQGRLAWETRIDGMAPDGQTPSRLHVITDAITGAYIDQFDDIETADGTGHSIYSGTVTIDTQLAGTSYQMIDQHNGSTCDMLNGAGTCTLFTDDDNVWGDGTNANRQSAAVDAHYGAGKTFDYFLNVQGRNGIFGDGRGVQSRVHFGDGLANAFWDTSLLNMNYGDGVGNARPVISLDVTGHEMTHGVTSQVVPGGGLIYSGESGGLNEATSDIFGTAVEFYANNPNDPGDYLIGEKIDIHGDGTPLRYMYDPALDGRSHSCWSTDTKFVDVHYSSGVANHFFFDLAEGTGATAWGFSPVCGTASGVVGLGRAKAEQIWFRALSRYFTSNTTYANARVYTLWATADLYGICSREYFTVRAAWDAVNVAGTDNPNCGPLQAAHFEDRLTPIFTAQSHQLLVSGGVTPYTWTVTGVPTGMTYDSATGLIFGTATEIGDYSVNYVVTDGLGATSFGAFNWIVYHEFQYITRSATATKPGPAFITARSRVRTAATAAGFDLANCQETDNTVELNENGTYTVSVTDFCFR